MPNPPTQPRKATPKSTKPAAKHKVSATSAKGQSPESMAQDTMLVSPTLLAAMITRSIAKGFEPILAELRDIARTSHDTSDRLFGEALKAKAHADWKENMGAAFAKSTETVRTCSEVERVETPTTAQDAQMLMDAMWIKGYRPRLEFIRSFHEFEEYAGR